MNLKYNPLKWQEHIPAPVNTLQIFITNRCNLRCKGCFYGHKLNNTDMSLDSYRNIIKQYSHSVKKITLLGGEPLLHPKLGDMITENNNHGLTTTVYTNGRYLEALQDIPPVDLRIGVLGLNTSEKPLSKIKSTSWPVSIVLMLRKDNIDQLDEVAKQAERFNCKSLYLSSIRDIGETNDYWKDTEDTISNAEYAEIIQSFVDRYQGNIPRLDISTRGIFKSGQVNCCRFGNVFPDGEKIICPLDIAKKSVVPELQFNTRKCNKHSSCVLQKIVLKAI
jgi:MoaA/NifB/PqqE/SkfB family radical SAM enzyme